MRPTHFVAALAALAILGACSSTPTGSVTAAERPALSGGYTSSGNGVPTGPDATTPTGSDTASARAPGYLGSGL